MSINQKDTVSKSYFSDSQRFAQVCNNALFGGKTFIHGEKQGFTENPRRQPDFRHLWH